MNENINLRVSLAVVSTACILIVGCDESSSDKEGHPIAIGSYNAGLAYSFTAYATARAPLVVEGLAAEPLDLLCVQEFFEEVDWEALLNVSPLPHAHRMAADNGVEPSDEPPVVCIAEEIDPLEACVRSSCDVPNDELTSCALAMCSDEVNALEPECLGCITGAIGQTDIDGLIDVCGPGGTGAASAYIFDGSFGIGLLSNSPLSGEDSLILDSTTTRRGVLYAIVADAVEEPLHVFCTHLTANLGSVPYTGEAGGWLEEQAVQIASILDYIDEKTGDGDRIVLLGDLNNGPVAGSATASAADNYALLTAAGFEDPYAQQDDAQCSYCSDNGFGEVGAADSGSLIDHIMLRDWSVSAAGSIFLDDTVTYDADGEERTTSPSDHYGVRLDIE